MGRESLNSDESVSRFDPYNEYNIKQIQADESLHMRSVDPLNLSIQNQAVWPEGVGPESARQTERKEEAKKRSDSHTALKK